MLDPYPPSVFHFKVSFGPQCGDLDTSFKEVSGLETTMSTEPYTEGGENRFVYELPTSIKHGNLVLKRGIGKNNSKLVKWCKTVLEQGVSEKIEVKSVYVFLLNGHRIPIRAWSFKNAYPVKWQVDAFDSMKNEVAIETIELSYNYSQREI